MHAGSDQLDDEEPAISSSHVYSVSVAAAVRDEAGRFLAIRRRDNGHWEPPGGIVEFGERLEDALVREVVEETGYLVRPTVLSGVYQNARLSVVSFVFSCALEGGEPATGPETTGVDWLTPSEVERRMSEAYAVRLLDSLRADVPVRVHDGHRLLA